MAEHTPGPFKLIRGGKLTITPNGKVVNYKGLTVIEGGIPADGELVELIHRANAFPDLLAALENIAEQGDQCIYSREEGYREGSHEAFAQCAEVAHDAIAKVKGVMEEYSECHNHKCEFCNVYEGEGQCSIPDDAYTDDCQVRLIAGLRKQVDRLEAEVERLKKSKQEPEEE